MLKVLGWIAGGFVLCVLLLGWWGYSRYKSFTAAGNVAVMSIHAPRERVFASIANSDSLSTWVGERTTIGARHGMFREGDTVRVDRQSARGDNRSEMTWTVTEVRDSRLIAMDVRADSSQRVLASRRDSLVSMGDSTIVYSTLSSPMIEAAQHRLADSSRETAKMLVDVSSKLALSVFRVQAENDLKRLKAHIEGR